MQNLQVGQLVRSSQGRDAGRFYVVVDKIGSDEVTVSDGCKRPLSKLKKKNLKHLQKYNKFVSQELTRKLYHKKASDRELRAELEKFTQTENLG